MTGTRSHGLLLAAALSAIVASTADAQRLARPPLEFEPVPSRPWTHVGRGAYTTLVGHRGFTVLGFGAAPARVAFELVGARRAAPTAEGRSGTVSHHLRGSDPTLWRLGVPRFERLRFEDAWEGIDVVLRGERGELRYDFELDAGRTTDPIRVRVAGARLSLRDGRLRIDTPRLGLEQPPPLAFQPTAAGPRPIDSTYVVLDDDEFGIRLGAHDPRLPVVIDPVLGFTSWLGGNLNDWPFDVAVDAQGFAYVVGATPSPDFPTARPLQGTMHGFYDAFVTKIDPSGTSIVWSTYLGGRQTASGGLAREGAVGVAIAPDGSPVVVGYTEATDFPVTTGAAQPALAGQRDLFVAKLDPNGTRLQFSTYLGGSAWEASEVAPRAGGSCDVAIDSAGRIVVAGTTQSTDLPLRNALQTTLTRGGDALVACYAPNGSLLVSTYLGGHEFERSVRVAIAPGDDIIVAGDSRSDDLPWTPGAWSGGNSILGFVARLSPTGRQLLACSSFPAPIRAVAVAPDGDVLVAGSTTDPGFVRTPGALLLDWFPPPYPIEACFVTRITGDLTALRWSTLVGLAPWLVPFQALAVDAHGDVAFALPWTVAGGARPDGPWFATLAADGRALLHAVPLQVPPVALATSPSGSTWIVGSSSPPHTNVQPSPNAFQQTPNTYAEGVVHRVDPTPTARMSIGPLDAAGHAGESLTATLALDGPAPPGGLTATLGGAPSAALRFPSRVTVPAGRTHTSFRIDVDVDAVPATYGIAASSSLGTVVLGVEVRRRAPYRLVPIHDRFGRNTIALDIGPDGTVVGGASWLSRPTAFSFALERGLAPIPAITAAAVTSSGVVYGVLEPGMAYRLDPTGAPEPLFDAGGWVEDANEHGVVVGYSSQLSVETRAYAWSPQTGRVDLHPAGSWGSWAYAVNDSGIVVGSHLPGPTGARRALAWSPTTGPVDLGTLPGHDEAHAFDINEHGEACGVSAVSGSLRSTAVIFANGSVLDLTAGTPTLRSQAWAINAHGQVAGQSPAGNGGAALWTPSTSFVGLEQLIDSREALGWQLDGAQAINDHGQITGVGRWGSYQTSFLLEPALLAPYGAGCPARSGRIPLLAGEGKPWRGETLTLVIDGATPAGPALLLIGRDRAHTPLVSGCALLVGGPFAETVQVDGTGRARRAFQLPNTLSRGFLYAQFAQVDLLAPSGLLTLSNGLEIRIE